MDEYVVLAGRVAAGLLAGVFFVFAVAIMPALRGADDHAFVDEMNRINVAIVNPVFVAVFLGAPALAVVAAVVDTTDLPEAQLARTSRAPGCCGTPYAQ